EREDAVGGDNVVGVGRCRVSGERVADFPAGDSVFAGSDENGCAAVADEVTRASTELAGDLVLVPPGLEREASVVGETDTSLGRFERWTLDARQYARDAERVLVDASLEEIRDGRLLGPFE